MDLEGMTGENAEPYFTLEDILLTLNGSPASSPSHKQSTSRPLGTSLSNFGDSSLAP